jgi:xylulokinase
MYLLGYDIGSSSVKVCLIEASSGKVIASNFLQKEMKITAIHPVGQSRILSTGGQI